MAALSAALPTQLDLAKMLDPDGKTLAQIIPILQQDNEILPRLGWMEANGGTVHRNTYHTSYPTPTWTGFNDEVAPTKGTTGQSVDGLGLMQAYSHVDEFLARSSGDVEGFRMRRDAMTIQGFSNEFNSTLFYGNADLVPEEFTGLSARYAYAGTNANITETAENIIHGGGTSGSVHTSIWIVTPNGNMGGVAGIYQRGTQAGIKMSNLGLQMVAGATAGKFAQKFTTHFSWSCGITVPDWRKNVRIPNIVVSSLTKNAGSGADIIDLVMQGRSRLPMGTSGSIILANRTIMDFLDRQARNSVVNSTLSYETVGGKPILQLAGMPVLRCDALLNTEAPVPVT